MSDDATMMDASIENTGNEGGFELDPMDLPAAILYMVFNAILAGVPIGVWYGYILPILNQSDERNTMYRVAWQFMWIGNLIFNGVPALLGGFAWLWNAFVTVGYIAWVQYLTVWGGSILQMINVILLIAGAATYEESDTLDIAGDNETRPWIEFAVWFAITGGAYAGIWLLNNNFLAYWTIEEIIHGISSVGTTDLWRIKYGTTDQKVEEEPAEETPAEEEPAEEAAAEPANESPFEEFDTAEGDGSTI